MPTNWNMVTNIGSDKAVKTFESVDEDEVVEAVGNEVEETVVVEVVGSVGSKVIVSIQFKWLVTRVNTWGWSKRINEQFSSKSHCFKIADSVNKHYLHDQVRNQLQLQMKQFRLESGLRYAQ